MESTGDLELDTAQNTSKSLNDSMNKDKGIVASHDGASDAVESASDEKQDKESGSLYSFFRVHWLYSTPLDHLLRFIGLVCAIGSGTALPLMTLVFGSSVNEFNNYGAGHNLSNHLYQSICHNALWFLYLFIGRFVLVYVYSICFGISGIRTVSVLRQNYIKSLLRQEIAYLDACSPGTVAATISNNADMVENGSTEKVGALIQAITMFVAAFAVAFSRQWALTLVTATTLPALFVGFYFTFSLDAKIEAKIMEIYNNAGGLVEEALSTIRIITAFGAQKKMISKYDVSLAEAQELGLKKGPIIGVQWSVEFFTTFCGYSLAWYYGVKLLNEGKIHSGGDVITVLLAVLLGTQAASDVAPGFGDFTRASAAAKGMFEVIDRPSKIDSLAVTGETLQEYEPSLQLRDIVFAYPSRATVKVLDRVSLDFESGKTTALVGASGSGKSTLVGLIERWFDPSSGSISLGGHNTTRLNIGWLRKQIGLVQQEPVLFNDTIYNNVAHGLRDTPMQKLQAEEKRELVREACIKAYADDFIQELPFKYDTKVGERGGLLSGGQKQRIAIARSIVSNPPILLLDEATSALDPTAEKKVQMALDNASESRTTILIAHKLSTVQKADKIVVLHQGNVLEQGTHEELLKLQGSYYKLVQTQNLVTISQPQLDLEGFTNCATEKSVESDTSEDASTAFAHQERSDDNESSDEDQNIPRKMSLLKCLYMVMVKEQKSVHSIYLAGIMSSIAGGGLFPAQGVLFGKSIPTLQLSPGHELVKRGDFWALMYFVLAVGVLFCYLGVGFFWTTAAFHATRFHRREYFGSMLRQDVGFFDVRTHSAAEMASRLSTHSQRLQTLLSTNLALIIVVIVNITSCTILSIAVGWQLGLVVVAGGLPVLFGSGYFRMRVEMTNHDRVSAIYLECARFATEAIGAIRTVSSLTLEQKVLDGYAHRLVESTNHEKRAKIISMMLYAFSESASLAVSGLAFWYGGKLLSEGKYDVTTFFIAFISVTMGSHAAGFLFGFSSDTSKAHSAANHILDLCASQPPISASSGADPIAFQEKDMHASIEFKNVSFNYATRSSRQALSNVSLTINRNESVGIVGASGSGKSTIISLIERFYDVTGGEILIQGQYLTKLDVHAYRSHLGLVSQETTLYHGSMKDNVLLGLKDVESKDCQGLEKDNLDQLARAACEAANIHEFIISLPDGYNTLIGNHGVALSGGQRQRLAIARALIRDPEILLFDEATSALDSTSELQVQQAVEAVARKNGRTTVQVAHRLSTVRRCDRIFVLHQGEIVEVGSHEELIEKRGQYYEMVQGQTLDTLAE